MEFDECCHIFSIFCRSFLVLVNFVIYDDFGSFFLFVMFETSDEFLLQSEVEFEKKKIVRIKFWSSLRFLKIRLVTGQHWTFS